jgi:hypothetical protein
LERRRIGAWRLRHGVRSAKKRLARKRAGEDDSDGYFNYALALSNCAMMGISKADADALTLWEYEGILWNYNEAHRSPDDVEPPDPEAATALLELLNNDPRLTH